MSSKTRIVVLHMKEVIYTAIFLLLGLLMIILLLIMFGPSKDKETASSVQTTSALTGQYLPGVYSTAIELNDNTFDVQVTVDSNHINSIELVNLSESTAAMYPLMEPALEELASQIYEKQSLEDLTCDSSSQYTSQILLDAIHRALSKAAPSEEVSLYSVTNV